MYPLGYALIVISLIAALYALVRHLVFLFTGQTRSLASGRSAVVVLFIVVLLSTSLLLFAFLMDDFSLRYVAENSRRGMPTVYKLTALWGGQQGSLLLWAFLLSLYTLFVTFYSGDEKEELAPVVTTILLGITAFFMVLVALVSNPFEPLNVQIADGRGLNPLLQDPGMVIHPLTLYIGYVGLAVPFAYAMAALIKRRADSTWIRLSRPWTMFSWLFLSVGIVYGGQWAYVELGWGGIWGWDPVENASLLPWLSATAYFHSVMVQEKRGMLKSWSIVLVVLTFLLTILGTFITRSGLLSSVHSFAEAAIGPYFLVFMGLVISGSVYLILDRRQLLQADNEFEALLSREGSFLLNNLLLVGAVLAVLWGTFYPLISRLTVNKEIMVGPAFFNRVGIPIGVLLIVLMGVCQLVGWRSFSRHRFTRRMIYTLAVAAAVALVLVATGITRPAAVAAITAASFVVASVLYGVARSVSAHLRTTTGNPVVTTWRLVNRHPRRYGSCLVHVAVALIVVGITGYGAYQQSETFAAVEAGDTMNVGQYSLAFQGLRQAKENDVTVVYADLVVRRDGQRLATVRPEKQFHRGYAETMGPTTEVAILGSLRHDIYVILAGWTDYGQAVTFRIIINPLVAWIWIGLYLLVAGTVFAAWPRAGCRRSRQLERLPGAVQDTEERLRREIEAEVARIVDRLADVQRVSKEVDEDEE